MAKVKSNKKYKEKTEKKKDDTSKGKTEKFFTVKSLSYVILFAIFLFSFYIRGITPIKTVFQQGIVGFATDDSVFHMRLVENTIQFFPHRIFFDAFTYYPNGTPLHWGPLFDQMIAFLAIVAGFVTSGGMPSQSVIDTVGAFFPAVIGALVVFPVYIIGKELLDEKAGLIGAFLIAILPGQWLSRSVLGFTDNHVAEVFYLTTMMMFFVIAIKKAENITFDHWLKGDWEALKTPLEYSLFAGIFFGAYLLNWTNGVFFAVVFGIFVVIQYIIDHFRGKSTEYLGIVGIIAYAVAMIMLIPYVDISIGFASGYYSLLHLAVTGGGAMVFAFLSVVSREMNKREYSGYHYLLFVSGTMLIGLIATKILLPNFYGATVGAWNFIFKGREGGGLTIAEASPITPEMKMVWFGYNYYLAYIAIVILFYYIIKKSNAEYTLVAVWSLFVLAITLAQNRFAYYYAVNVAILIGFLGSKILDFGDWNRFDSNDIVECITKIRIQHVLSIILVVAVIGFLPAGASPYRTTMADAQWGAIQGGYYEWHDALTWMRYNTPVPELPYYSIYEKPPAGQKYNYSKNDYGVMSWWDYGHIITYWARRIPDANPFQQGIGGGSSHAPGASTFLIAQTEADANEVLERLGIDGKPGARYVVSNAYMAYVILTIFADWDLTDQGYYTKIQTSQGLQAVPTMKYYDTMEAKLHIFDTNNLHNYRLVHESAPNPQAIYVYGSDEKWFKNVYNVLYGGNLIVEDSGYAKIFEYVKGAIITGKAPANTTVIITNTIKTNIGRTIQYSQTTSSDGTYSFTVPYSTLGPIPGETQFDTRPAGAYTVAAGNVSKTVDIGEKDVLEGRTVVLNLV
ncbi:MAG: oligosaccharyl transferase, archaeosortase A system-associated [Candidatus Methanoperedens sp.]|nr:oligosaccharyl transferase, archaeosortase A system-associated [Candidatus Methanoperedens sp.]